MTSDITRDTYKDLDSDAKLLVLFDMVSAIQRNCPEQAAKCSHVWEGLDDRLKKLENRKKTDTAAAAAGGFLGGVSAFITSKLFGL